MGTDTGDWMDAALVDLEARKAKIETMIAHIRELQAHGSSAPGPGGGAARNVGPSAFLKMSIADAAKKHLENVNKKQSTQDVIDALEDGGLPRGKYSTVYSILARRAKLVGDIINMHGDWALKEWYPNYRPSAKDAKSTNGDKKDEGKAEASGSGVG